MKKHGLLAAVAAVALATSAQAAALYNIATVNLNATFTSTSGTGNQPGAVAWDGSSLFVAGYNNSGATGTVGIVPITNVLTTPVIGSTFGSAASTVNGRGYVSADVRGGSVVFGLDSGTTSTSAISSYSTSTPATPTLNFSKAPAGRPHAVAVDPIAGTGNTTNVSSVFQGSSSLRRDNIISGTADGNVAAPSTLLGTAYRDLDFNDANGDVYFRVNNLVARAIRSTATSFTAAGITTIASPTTANNPGQNLAYLNSFPGGDLVIYNDRAATGTTQAFATVVRAVTPTGTAEPLTFSNADGSAAFTAANGTAWYDFSWDSASQTLAISDFSNRQVYIFAAAPAVVPEPTGALLALPAAAMIASRRRRA